MAEKKDMRDPSPQDIHKEIDRTRSRINNTLDQLMDRFSPERLKSRAFDEIRSATGPGSKARETSSSLVEAVRNNPIPAAMAGAGLIILFARGSERGLHGKTVTLETTGEEAGEKVQEAKDKVYDISHRVRGKAEDLKGQTREKAGYAKEEISEKAVEVKSVFHDLIQNNPLAVMAAAFAIGSAIGLGLPGTRKEEELLGETGSALRKKALEKAEDVEKKAAGGSERAA